MQIFFRASTLKIDFMKFLKREEKRYKAEKGIINWQKIVQYIYNAHIILYNWRIEKELLVMNETTNLSIRIDKELKEQAENLFSELGMNMTTAFNIFVRQSVRQGKIPFEISLNKPNAKTLEALQEVE